MDTPKTLITTPEYEGYYGDDIMATMTPAELKQWSEWYYGQTGAIHEGKFLVYKWDWEDYLAGLPVTD